MTLKPILLVEDTRTDEILALEALSASKVANPVHVVRDGAEALDYLFCEGRYATRTPEMPQVMLLDLKLPKIDGLDVLRRVRAHAGCHSLPVVILTSSKEDRDLVESYALGANSYVRKPLAFDGFMEAIGQLGLYWAVINQAPPDRSPRDP